MVQFYQEYSDLEFVQPVVAQIPKSNDFPCATNMQPLVAQTPWTHNIILMQKVKDRQVREWYMQQLLENGWSKVILLHMIDAQVHKRQGKITSNFNQILPPVESDLVQQSFKDPYVFDFLTIDNLSEKKNWN